MAEFDSRNRRPEDPADDLTALALRYLDGLAGPEEVVRLNTELLASADSRGLFVRVCRLHGLLSETLAPRRVTLKIRSQARRQTATAPDPAAVRGGPSGKALPAGQRLPAEDPPSPAAEPGLAGAAAGGGADTLFDKVSGEDTIHTDQTGGAHPEALPPNPSKKDEAQPAQERTILSGI
jgi:hypothetical protein